MATVGFGVVVGAIVLVEALIVITALRMPTPRTGYSAGVIGSRGAEVLWTLLPSVLLAVLAVLTLRALQDRLGS